jgi:hypothetical protein
MGLNFTAIESEPHCGHFEQQKIQSLPLHIFVPAMIPPIMQKETPGSVQAYKETPGSLRIPASEREFVFKITK